MRILLVVAATIAIGYVGAPPVSAQDAPLATLTVTGQGQIFRAPDRAAVAVAIVTNDGSATHALSENNRRYAALIAKLGADGVAASDIISTSIQSYYAPPSDRGGIAAGQLFGFVVTRNVQINVNALVQTGAAVDAATAAGATQINGVTYGFRDRREVERAALAAAVADAHAQAEAIASAAHVQIVRILRIGNDAAPGRIMPLAMNMARTTEAPVPTAIAPSDLEVASSVSVTYVIR